MARAGTTVYKWVENGDITQASILSNRKGEAIAYLHASENSPNLHEIREILKGQGWITSSDARNGQPVLRVTGLPNQDALLNILQHGGYAQGQPQISTPDGKGIGGSLKRDSKLASAVLYTAGDFTMLESGRRHGNNIWQMGTGIAFALGDVMFALFGGYNEHSEFKSLLEGAQKNFQDKGITVPEDSALNAETAKKSAHAGGAVYEFIHKYITQFKIAMEIVGGALLFKGGRAKPDAAHPNRFPSPRKQVSGAVIVAGWAAALSVPEKKLDKEEYAKAGILKKAWMKVQSSPLRFAGLAGIIHNISFTIAAFEERNKFKKGAGGTKDWWNDLLVIGFMLPANILFALSKKKGGQSEIKDKALSEDVYGIMAQVINRQPDEASREQAFKAAADFLDGRSEIKGTKTEIDDRLRNEVDFLRNKNPWFAAKTTENEAPQGNSAIQEILAQRKNIQMPPRQPAVPREKITRPEVFSHQERVDLSEQVGSPTIH